MRWRWWLRWRDPTPEPPKGNGAAAAAKRTAEAKLRKAERDYPVVEHIARRMASLPPDEFADRVVRAFGRRPA